MSASSFYCSLSHYSSAQLKNIVEATVIIVINILWPCYSYFKLLKMKWCILREQHVFNWFHCKKVVLLQWFPVFFLGFSSINDDNINFMSLREVTQNTIFLLCYLSWFKHPCLFHNQTPWKDLQCSELSVHAHIHVCFGVQCHGFIGSIIVLQLCTFAMV